MILTSISQRYRILTLVMALKELKASSWQMKGHDF